MITIGLIVSYSGTPFAGWQRQPDAPTVQGCLEKAVSCINHAPTEVRGASRTDAGVHAEYQIAAFDTDRTYDPARWQMAINALTPPEIMVRHAFIAPDGFQPRFASRGKHYRYLYWQEPYVPPMLVNRCARSRILNVDNMQKAAQVLTGEHDFSSFRAIDCQAKSPVRTITQINVSISQCPYVCPCADEKRLLQIDVYGTAFLKQMVRIIAGTLVSFGLGRNPAQMQDILNAHRRSAAGETAEACGLTLIRAFSELDDSVLKDWIGSAMPK